MLLVIMKTIFNIRKVNDNSENKTKDIAELITNQTIRSKQLPPTPKPPGM